MDLQQAKANSSRVRRPHSRSAPGYQIDEALWAAYRRYDRSAVTEKLLRHYLPGVALIPELNAAPDPGGESVRNEIISGRDRSENRSRRGKCPQTTHPHGKNLLLLTNKPGNDKHGFRSGLKNVTLSQ